MSEFKTLLSSKTFWGALVAVLASVLSLFGYQIGVAEQSELISIGTGFAGAAAGAGVASSSISNIDDRSSAARTLSEAAAFWAPGMSWPA